MKTKLIRTSTVAISLNKLLKGQLKFLSKEFEVIGLSSSGTDLDEVKDREGVKTIAVEMQRGMSPFKDIVSLVKLYLVFKKEKPQIVHSITPKAGLLCMLAAKFAGVPIRMHTFTGLIFPTRTGAMQKLLIKMDQLLCWAATNIYPEGNGVKNDLLKYKITSKPLKVLANGNVNGIDLTYFSKDQISEEKQVQLKQELGIQPTDFVFIFVGRLVGDKGINELVKSFKRLSTDVENVKLLLVGPFENNLDPLKKNTIEEIDSNNKIIAVGAQKDVRPYFAIANVLVFPSYREGFPNVVMQAGAMGLPSIVTNINGCNEIIIEGENGLIIPVKNIELLYQAMIKILNEKDEYRIMSQKSRDLVVKRYEQKYVWEQLLKEYQSLI